MVSIKSEPLNSLEDDILHVLCVKPEPDVFFDHFIDSPLMDNIHRNFNMCLEELEEYFCAVVQYLDENGNREYIPRITISSIGAYRNWYKEVCEPLVQYDFNLHNGAVYRGNNRIKIDNLRSKQAGIKNALIHLNCLVNRFEKSWGRIVFLSYRSLYGTMELIEEHLDQLQSRYVNSTESIELRMLINGARHVDNVTNSIIQTFPNMQGFLFD